MESSSPELTPREPLERRIKHYQNRAESLLNRHGRDFAHFTQGYEQLVAEGDERLRRIETTGYNILHRASDMPLSSKRPLIFYGNYIGHAQHFGLLLAAMEQRGIITPEQIRFGVRGAKVLWNPDWGDVPPELAQIGTIQRVNPEGEVSEHEIRQSVETVITFSPRINDNEQAAAIADFLRERAKRGVSGAIEDSNVDPDIRATTVLRNVLSESEFPNAIANMLSIGRAQLVVLRKETSFAQPLRATPIEANRELVTYLIGEGVLP